jgi:RNA-binding protein 5/10
MFYESLSDFFYDPKSKLYYGNKKCAYFQYDDSMSPAFVEIQKVDAGSTQHGANTQDQEALLASAAAKDHTTMSVTNKSKIAIKLKTKKLKSVSSTPVSSSGSFVVPSKSHKDQIANIEKWTEKQAELKNSVHGGKVPLPDANSGSQHPQPSARLPAAPPGGVAATISASSKIRMTAKGEPVCLICKRKFPTVDKLRLHEKASDLHKQNLRQIHEAESNKRKLSDLSADLTAFGKTTVSDPPTAPTEYEDRAQKRRQLHGPDVPFGAGQQARSFSLQFETQRAPPAPLDETNVGHQMLQKLGWKGGDKSSQEGSADGSDTRSTSSTHQLRKDWDRIEAIAGNPAQQQQPNNS